jgi:hypothetical protein
MPSCRPPARRLRWPGWLAACLPLTPSVEALEQRHARRAVVQADLQGGHTCCWTTAATGGGAPGAGLHCTPCGAEQPRASGRRAPQRALGAAGARGQGAPPHLGYEVNEVHQLSPVAPHGEAGGGGGINHRLHHVTAFVLRLVRVGDVVGGRVAAYLLRLGSTDSASGQPAAGVRGAAGRDALSNAPDQPVRAAPGPCRAQHQVQGSLTPACMPLQHCPAQEAHLGAQGRRLRPPLGRSQLRCGAARCMAGTRGRELVEAAVAWRSRNNAIWLMTARCPGVGRTTTL